MLSTLALFRQRVCSQHRAFVSSSSPSSLLFRISPFLRPAPLKPRITRYISNKLQSTFSKPSILFISFVGVSVASRCGGIVIRAECQEKPALTRLTAQKQPALDSENFDWRGFWAMLRPDILLLIGAVLSAVAVAIINIQIPALLGTIVNVIKAQSGTYVKDMRQPCTHLITMYALQGVFTFFYITLLSHIGENVAFRMRVKLFESIIRQDMEFFDRHRTGELMNRLTSDVQDFKSCFKHVISQGLRSLAQTVGCVVSMFYISSKMTGIMILVIPGIILTGTLIGSVLRKYSKEAQAQAAKAASVADEALGNVRTVRAFAMEDKELNIFSKEVANSGAMNARLGIGIGAFQGATNIALNGIVLGVLYMGGLLISQNEMSAGALMSFLVSAQTIQRSLAQMSLLFGQFVRGIAAGSHVFEYINLEPSMKLSGGKKIAYHTFKGNIDFYNVTFSYPTRPEQEILKKFNLKIPAGNVVALCGTSGGGKSTIAVLLERFYDVKGGTIRIDGVDIRRLDPSWLRGRAIGFINQEPVLFAMSVMENIRYGRPDATDQEVIEAAQSANADGFIRSFPHGYNTILGERGVTVSGGQKQRIAIARALLKNPRILILDEATSALDAESEKIVQDALDQASKGRTVLVIAHRLSTIKNADTIAVIANGNIAEIGTHKQLKRKRGLYYELIKQQDQSEGASDGG